MKVAICFYGLSRTFKETSKNIKENLINQPEHEVDIFISTWEEENIDIESELKNLYNPKKIIVEKYNDEISNYKEMFREYPMFYKINSVVNLALDSDNYDLMFLVRLDVVYEKKFDFLSIKKDIFYYGQGVFDPLINKVRKYWKLNIFKVDEFYDIWKADPQSQVKWPKLEYINPISDVLNYGSPECIKKYIMMIQLIELYKKKFEKANPARIKFEKILREMMHFMPKSKIFYKIYVVLSKMFGFFMPFSNGNEPVSIKHLKPGLVGYQIAFNNINCEISDMKYRFER